MFRSHRGIIFAMVGIAVAVVAVVMALTLQPENPNLAGNAGYQEEAADYQAGGGDCQQPEIERLTGRKRTRRAATCAEAEEEHRLKANDLIQQRRAADAAEASAVIAYQQTRIAAWGIALGIVTMAAAVGAALYARSAAKAAENSFGLEKDLAKPRLEVSAALANAFCNPAFSLPRSAPAVINVANRGATQVSEFKIDRAVLKIDGRPDVSNLRAGHHMTEHGQPFTTVSPHGGVTTIGLWGFALGATDREHDGSDVSISLAGTFRDAFGIDHSWEAITTGNLAVHPFGNTEGYQIGAVLQAIEVTIKD